MIERSNLIKLAPLFACVVVAGACSEGWTDITELNENPNEPATVLPELVLTEGMQEAFDELLGGGLNLDYGEHLVQHVSEIAYAEEDVYTYRNTEINTRFREAYAEYLMDFQEVIELGTEDGQDNVVAVGLIMKSWTFQSLTDIWGDLPYSQAFQGDSAAVIAPAYDTQQAIYDGMLADVTTAGGMLDASTDPFGAQDLVYQGDMALWQKFANSLRLRLAMRLSEVDAPKAQTEFNAALNAPGGVFTSNADNAQVCYGDITRHPWFESFEGRPNDFRVAATLIDTLKAYNDPRLGVYAAPIESESVEGEPVPDPFYRGMPSGMPDGHGYSGSETSKPGKEYFLSADACLSLMTFAEVRFLQAEAAARGWTGGDAEQLYYDAIRASLEHWGIGDPEIDAYLAQPEVQWTGNWREQIGLQKWLALFGQGLEAYAEVRRLDYPVLTPGPAASLEQIPARYPYPFSEETLNGDNLKAAVQQQGMGNRTDQTTPVWWDVN